MDMYYVAILCKKSEVSFFCYRMAITGTNFNPKTTLPGEELNEVVAQGAGSVARAVLDKKGWGGNLVVTPIVQLAMNNKLVMSCKMTTKGALGEVEINARRYFPDMEKPYKIMIRGVDMDMFEYGDELVSKWVADENLDLEYSVEDEERTKEEYKSDGGKPFCVRVHMKPISEEACKVTLALLPKSIMEAGMMPGQGAGVPGFKLVAKDAPFFPTTKTEWGLKFIPLLLKGSPAEELETIDNNDLRRAIHSTLQRAVAITFCRNIGSFDKKWKTMTDKNEVPAVAKLDAWPEHIHLETGEKSKNSSTVEGERNILLRIRRKTTL